MTITFVTPSVLLRTKAFFETREQKPTTTALRVDAELHTEHIYTPSRHETRGFWPIKSRLTIYISSINY